MLIENPWNPKALVSFSQASFGSQDGRRRIVDPTVLATCSQESLSIAISITNKCISLDSSTRPSAEDILWNLQYAAQIQATADGDQRTDTAPYHWWGYFHVFFFGQLLGHQCKGQELSYLLHRSILSSYSIAFPNKIFRYAFLRMNGCRRLCKVRLGSLLLANDRFLI